MTKHRQSARRPSRGEMLRVRSREEILATLDADGTIESLPFMPEMLDYCGKELPISARAHKTCDSAEHTGLRRLNNTVHLAGARCDGSAHGGCQAGCLLFWREEWLESPEQPGRPVVAAIRRGVAEPPVPVDALHAATQVCSDDGTPTYRCQATQLRQASSPVRRRELWQYVADLRSRNVGLRVLLRGLLIDAFNKYQRFSFDRLPAWLRIRDALEYPFIQFTGTGAAVPTVGLEAGELVEVRSRAEVQRTLGPRNRNRGMNFNKEMLPYCGGRYRVARTVERILDETTGKMLKLSDCAVLEGVVCQGIYHDFCRKEVPPYWREAWLRRVSGDQAPPRAPD